MRAAHEAADSLRVLYLRVPQFADDAATDIEREVLVVVREFVVRPA